MRWQRLHLSRAGHLGAAAINTTGNPGYCWDPPNQGPATCWPEGSRSVYLHRPICLQRPACTAAVGPPPSSPRPPSARPRQSYRLQRPPVLGKVLWRLWRPHDDDPGAASRCPACFSPFAFPDSLLPAFLPRRLLAKPRLSQGVSRGAPGGQRLGHPAAAVRGPRGPTPRRDQSPAARARSRTLPTHRTPRPAPNSPTAVTPASSTPEATPRAPRHVHSRPRKCSSLPDPLETGPPPLVPHGPGKSGALRPPGRRFTAPASGVGLHDRGWGSGRPRIFQEPGRG